MGEGKVAKICCWVHMVSVHKDLYNLCKSLWKMCFPCFCYRCRRIKTLHSGCPGGFRLYFQAVRLITKEQFINAVRDFQKVVHFLANAIIIIFFTQQDYVFLLHGRARLVLNSQWSYWSLSWTRS